MTKSTMKASTTKYSVYGWLKCTQITPVELERELGKALTETGRSFVVVELDGRLAISSPSSSSYCGADTPGAVPIVAIIPAYQPSKLGNPEFLHDHGLRYPYVAGAMANGISSLHVVEAMGKAGMLGFFGTGGLSLGEFEEAILRVQAKMEGKPYGFNLVYNPLEGAYEETAIGLLLRYGVTRLCAAAYMDLTLALVRYRTRGIRRDESGRVVAPNHLFGKISRIEVARKFFSPPPETLLRILIQRGELTEQEAEMARTIPMAQDVTVEADSGGHTDKSPAICQFPAMVALRNKLQDEFHYTSPLRIGAAGGIATPQSAASAFTMGAAYIMTGSINQACRESGTSDAVKAMLAKAEQADVAMAPAADMFEMGIKVQVLKRGTMFPMKAQKLYDLYRSYGSIEDLPAKEIEMLEKNYFRTSIPQTWEATRNFWLKRDPENERKADREPKHRMALIFRWYLGQASRWAIAGTEDRSMDYQVWCGPAMGAFNEWVKGSYLEAWENRRVVDVAANILRGCAILKRAEVLTMQGIQLPPGVPNLRPPDLEELQEHGV